MKPFRQTYQQAVEKLFDPLTSEDGTPEEEIAEAENRLGFHLPQTLREFYLLAGRRDDLNQSHHYLFNPEELSVEGDALIFYAENQGVVLWGIHVNDTGRNNPPVVVAVNDDVFEWEPDFEQLSDFLLWMLYHQAIEKYGSSSVRNESLLDAIRHGLCKVVKRMLDEGMEARTKNRGLICAVMHDQTNMVRLLLQDNADANARDEEIGKTPLMYAEEYKASEEVVRALKAAGAVE
jgi:ankyrin repeat protein